ncbi:hypothetical protein AB9F41_37360, partial [Rhizobium leguminosarum]
RIAPGESNTWYIRVLGIKKSAFFSTKSPRQWQWMDYNGGAPSFQHHREILIPAAHEAADRGIVPGGAGQHAALAVRTLG